MSDDMGFTDSRSRQLLELQLRLTELANEGAVGMLSKTDVALLSWALGVALAHVEGMAEREGS